MARWRFLSLLLAGIGSAHGAELPSPDGGMPWGTIAMTMFGGLALCLWKMPRSSIIIESVFDPEAVKPGTMIIGKSSGIMH